MWGERIVTFVCSLCTASTDHWQQMTRRSRPFECHCQWRGYCHGSPCSVTTAGSRTGCTYAVQAAVILLAMLVAVLTTSCMAGCSNDRIILLKVKSSMARSHRRCFLCVLAALVAASLETFNCRQDNTAGAIVAAAQETLNCRQDNTAGSYCWCSAGNIKL